MPGKPDKQHRIRVRTVDGKPRDRGAINKLKSNQLGMPHLDIVGTNVVIICASKDTHIEQVRGKLQGAGRKPSTARQDHRSHRHAETGAAATTARETSCVSAHARPVASRCGGHKRPAGRSVS